MSSIFYDLETSDQLTVGQILNYSFIYLADNRTIADELSGSIRLRPCELPSPSAIMANKVNVLELQKTALDNERTALTKIHSFIDRIVKNSSTLVDLVGYNSNRFDLNFLRTSFIRNGINPYFSGRLKYRDLLQLAQYLSLTNPDFPRIANKTDSNKLSLKLETLTQALDLLEGQQTHESRDDVLLTIKFAQELDQKFQAPIWSFEAYPDLKNIVKGQVWQQFSPEYNLSAVDIKQVSSMLLLDKDAKSSLWVDLEQYQKGNGVNSIRWFSGAKHAVFLGQRQVDLEGEQTVQQALQGFSNVNLRNFFKRSTCDIEADIYRLDFNAIETLSKAIYKGEVSKIFEQPSADLIEVFKRFSFNNMPEGPFANPKIATWFAAYCKMRYGESGLDSSMLISRDDDSQTRKTTTSYAKLQEELQSLREARLKEESMGNSKDLTLLQALESYYKDSPVFKSIFS